MPRSLIVGLAALALCSCAVTRGVRPVGEGNAAAGVSLGGPVFANAAPYVVPLVSAWGRYGLTPTTDVDLGLHLPIAGAAGMDLGLAHLFRPAEGAAPALMAGVRGLLFVNALDVLGRTNPNQESPYTLSPRLFEEFYATLSWAPRERWLVWAGASFFLQAEAGRFLPSVLAGAEWRATDRFGLALEVKDLALTTVSDDVAVSWAGIGGHGALAAQVGLNFYFGGAK